MTSEPDTRSMRERMLAGDLYIADDPELAAPAIFQATYRHFAWATFADELGKARALPLGHFGAPANAAKESQDHGGIDQQPGCGSDDQRIIVTPDKHRASG